MKPLVYFSAIAIALAVLLVGCGTSINEDITIEAGSVTSTGARTINGNIIVSDGAQVDEGELASINGAINIGNEARVGEIDTVNGSITIGDVAETGSISTVNGPLKTGEGVKVRGDVSLVNGEVQCRAGSTFTGDIATVNGQITLRGATVDGKVTNYNGGMLITDGTTVKGSLIVKRPTRLNRKDDEPLVVIGPNSRVIGDLQFERPVRLFVHETAETGPIEGADPVTYTGELPDQI